MSGEIVNKVAQSGIETLDLASLRPAGQRRSIDVAEVLWQGIALKETDFRQWVKETDWSAYTGTQVAVHCSADAIVPSWVYMVLGSELAPYAETVHFGDLASLEEYLYARHISQMDLSVYRDSRIMLKGCGEEVPTGAYLYLTQRLREVAKSVMFGEPCSAVPVYKRKK